MPGREIENVVFIGNTEIFEERKKPGVFFFTFTDAYIYVLKVG